MDCQFHNNCGGYCETTEEKVKNLCENCLESEKEQDAFKAELDTLVAEAKEAIALINNTGSQVRLETITLKLASLYD